MNEGLRELDQLVAETIFGRDRMTARVDPMNRDGEPQYYWGYPAGHDFAPSYSSDITAAMAVVEQMRSLCDVALTTHGNAWQVVFSGLSKGNTKYGAAKSDSLAWAICYAALMASESK